MIGVNRPGWSYCKETWCDYTFWGSCKHTYSERILNGPFETYIVLVVAIVATLALLIFVGNFLIARYYLKYKTDQCIPVLLLTITLNDILVGIVAVLHLISFFLQTMPCNSQPPEDKVGITWIRFQAFINLVFMVVTRSKAMMICVLCVIKAINIYFPENKVNHRYALIFELFVFLGWAVGLSWNLGLSKTGSNIYLPLYVVTVRDDMTQAYLMFILLDFLPFAVPAMLTFLAWGLVFFAVLKTNKGFSDRDTNTSYNVLITTGLYFIRILCCFAGAAGIQEVYTLQTFQLSQGYLITYLLAVVSVFVNAAADPLIVMQWDRGFRQWIVTPSEHVYQSVTYSQYSMRTDTSSWFETSSWFSFVKDKFTGKKSMSIRTDRSTLFEPASPSTAPPSIVPSGRSYITDRSSVNMSPTHTPARTLSIPDTDWSSNTGLTSMFRSGYGGTGSPTMSTARTDQDSYQTVRTFKKPRPPPTYTRRTDLSSVVTTPTIELPTPAPSLTQRTDVSSTYNASPEYIAYTRKAGMIEAGRDELNKMRSEHAKLMKEYQTNHSLISGVSGDQSTVYLPGDSVISDESHITQRTDRSSNIGPHLKRVKRSADAKILPARDTRDDRTDISSAIQTPSSLSLTTPPLSRLTDDSSDITMTTHRPPSLHYSDLNTDASSFTQISQFNRAEYSPPTPLSQQYSDSKDRSSFVNLSNFSDLHDDTIEPVTDYSSTIAIGAQSRVLEDWSSDEGQGDHSSYSETDSESESEADRPYTQYRQ